MAKLSMPAGGMTRIHSGVTLHPNPGSITATRSGRPVSMSSFNSACRGVLRTVRAAEQYYVNQNWATYKHAQTRGYTSAAGRSLTGGLHAVPGGNGLQE
jgi:hypothetical protein